MIPRQYRDAVLFLALAGAWGVSFVAIDVGLTGLPPVLFAAFRYDVAGLALLAAAVAVRNRWRPETYSEWRQVVVGGTLLVGVHFALMFTGQQYVTGTVASVVSSLAPVLTPAFAWLLLPRAALHRRTAVGVVLGLLGVVIVARPDPATLDGQVVGVGLLVLATASFALGAVLHVRWANPLPLLPAQAWMMLTGAVELHVLAAASGQSPADAAWSPAVVVALAYLALVASAAAFVVYFRLLARLGPVEMSLVSYVVPAFAAAAGWVLLAEPIAPTTVAGFGVILVGFAVHKWETVAPTLSALRRSAVGVGRHLRCRYDAYRVGRDPVEH